LENKPVRYPASSKRFIIEKKRYQEEFRFITKGDRVGKIEDGKIS
jgi:hypothetical protein